MFDQIGNFLRRHEKPPFFGEFINDPPFAGVNPADCRRFILRQGVMAGQIGAIDIQHRPNRQSDHGDAHRHKREDSAEK